MFSDVHDKKYQIDFFQELNLNNDFQLLVKYFRVKYIQYFLRVD